MSHIIFGSYRKIILVFHSAFLRCSLPPEEFGIQQPFSLVDKYYMLVGLSQQL